MKRIKYVLICTVMIIAGFYFSCSEIEESVKIWDCDEKFIFNLQENKIGFCIQEPVIVQEEEDLLFQEDSYFLKFCLGLKDYATLEFLHCGYIVQERNTEGSSIGQDYWPITHLKLDGGMDADTGKPKYNSFAIEVFSELLPFNSNLSITQEAVYSDSVNDYGSYIVPQENTIFSNLYTSPESEQYQPHTANKIYPTFNFNEYVSFDIEIELDVSSKAVKIEPFYSHQIIYDSGNGSKPDFYTNLATSLNLIVVAEGYTNRVVEGTNLTEMDIYKAYVDDAFLPQDDPDTNRAWTLHNNFCSVISPYTVTDSTLVGKHCFNDFFNYMDNASNYVSNFFTVTRFDTVSRGHIGEDSYFSYDGDKINSEKLVNELLNYRNGTYSDSYHDIPIIDSQNSSLNQVDAVIVLVNSSTAKAKMWNTKISTRNGEPVRYILIPASVGHYSNDKEVPHFDFDSFNQAATDLNSQNTQFVDHSRVLTNGIAHELGHALSNIWDEYVSGAYPNDSVNLETALQENTIDAELSKYDFRWKPFWEAGYILMPGVNEQGEYPEGFSDAIDAYGTGEDFFENKLNTYYSSPEFSPYLPPNTIDYFIQDELKGWKNYLDFYAMEKAGESIPYNGLCKKHGLPWRGFILLDNEYQLYIPTINSFMNALTMQSVSSGYGPVNFFYLYMSYFNRIGGDYSVPTAEDYGASYSSSEDLQNYYNNFELSSIWTMFTADFPPGSF